jgi:hypothetical protein
MRPRRFAVLAAALILGTLVGCATTPNVLVRRPWYRTDGEADALRPQCTTTVVAQGDSLPLTGGEEIRIRRFQELVSDLAKRRGVSDENSGQRCRQSLKLTYRTERRDLQATASISASSTYLGSATTSRTYGQGVALATQMSTRTVAASTNTSSLIVATQRSYTHTIGLELLSSQDELAWQGESTWDSTELDIFAVAPLALQLIMSRLPQGAGEHPSVGSVRPDRQADYYYGQIPKAVSCPALHAPVRFYNNDPAGQFAVPSSIEDGHAMAAYADLVSHAEYALPTGEFSTFTHEVDFGSDPTEFSLWRTVQLGGEYRVGPKNEPTKVLIDLYGEDSGYRVTRAWVASDEEFAEYEANIRLWRKALSDYFDFFVK